MVVAEYRYAAVCTMAHDTSQPLHNGCNITITSEKNVSVVTMSTVRNEWTTTVQPNETYIMTVGQHLLPDEGVEDVVIYVQCNNPLRVVVFKTDDYEHNRSIGAYQVYDVNKTGNEYYVITYPEGATFAQYVKEFFIVAAFDNNTLVSIDQGGNKTNVTLNHFQAFTMKSLRPNANFTGTRITANNSISLVTGNLYAINPFNYYGQYMTSLSPVSRYSKDYTVPALGGSSDNGYLVTLLAANHTTALINNESYVIAAGKGLDYIQTNASLPTSIHCNDSCLPVQYSRNWPQIQGYFKTDVIANDDFYDFASFFAPNVTTTHHVSIIVDGHNSSVYFDLESINATAWLPFGNMSYTVIPTTSGMHNISSNSSRFAAYLHAYIDDWGAYGISLHNIHNETAPNITLVSISLQVTNNTLSLIHNK